MSALSERDGRFMIYPPTVRPGDPVCVIAPSGPFDRGPFDAGIAELGRHYRVAFEPSLYDRQGFLAGSDARRLHELNQALRNPDYRAIIAARGGHGLTRIASAADFGALRRHPKWIVGFSDITLLHWGANAWGVASIHASNVTGLGKADAEQRASFHHHLQQAAVPLSFEGLESAATGRAQGRLFGGNLSLVLTALVVRSIRPPDGGVLLLEEVGEPPYRIDRMLSALFEAGAFDRLGAICVGDITASEPGPHGVSVGDVLRERLGRLGIPVLLGLPIGHGERNRPLTLGAWAEVDGVNGRLTLTCPDDMP